MAEYRRPTGPEAVRRFNEEPGWGRFPSMIGLEMLEVERDRIRGRLETTDQLIAGTGFLWAPVVVGVGEAVPAHIGRTTHVWDVTVTNEATGRTIALQRCTQMVLYPEG